MPFHAESVVLSRPAVVKDRVQIASDATEESNNIVEEPCYRGKRIAVVVPAYNEEALIGETLDSIPDYVARVYAVDDGSSDRTGAIIDAYARHDPRLVPIHHNPNRGVGAAITSGYRRAIEDGMDIAAVMAGDNQMDPAYLPDLLNPIVDGVADFTKGNRMKPGYWVGMSEWRLFGNLLLNEINKIASGYWHIGDPQNGYVVISSAALSKLNLDKLYPRYAFENDMMIKSNIAGIRIMSIYIPARYGAEKSHIRYGSFIIKTSCFLFRSFLWRIGIKFLKTQHPVYVAYGLGIILIVLGSITAFYGEWKVLPLGILLSTIACIGEARQTIKPVIEPIID